MPIGAAAGTPQYSGNYIPEYFSQLMLVALYESTCLNSVANSNWEGELKKGGDTIIIRTLPEVTIRDRAKNGKVIIENLDSPSITLSIDYEKYFAFSIDRVDEFQSDLPLQQKFAEHASKEMNIAIEIAVFADIYADVHASNSGLTAGSVTSGYNMGVSGTPFAVTKANAYDKIVDMNSVLGEQFAAREMRWVVIPEAFANKLAKSDLKDAQIYKDGSPIAKDGWMAKMPVSGMDIYNVDTLTSVSDTYTCFHVLFGQKEALTFASQFNETDEVKGIDFRGKAVRGFNDYGYEVVKSELMGDFYCYFPTE